MITREELIRSKEYWLTKLQNDLFGEVEKYLADNNLSKTEFSKKLGVSKGYISQILNGDFDHKISKLIELSLAIDKVPFLKFESLSKHVFPDSFDVSERSTGIRNKVKHPSALTEGVQKRQRQKNGKRPKRVAV